MTTTLEIAELPVGALGLTGNRNESQVNIGELLIAENITFESGLVRKEGGSSKYNSTAITGNPSIKGGWDYFPVLGTQRMIVYTGTSLLKDTGGGSFSVTLASGLNDNDSAVFVEGGNETLANNKKLFIFTNTNQLKVLSGDGATVANVALPPTDWATNPPISGILHENRLWGFSSHFAYYSSATNHEDFTTGGQLAIYPGEGDEIVAGASFRGRLVLFKKPQGVYVVDTTDPTPTNWRVIRITDGIGTFSPNGLAMLSINEFAFIDDSGLVRLVSASDILGSFQEKDLTEINEMGDFIRDNTAFKSNKEKARMIYYPEKKQLMLALPQSGFSLNNSIINWQIGKVVRPSFNIKDTALSMWLRRDVNSIRRPVVGDDNGFVWSLDQANKNRDGSGYEGRFQSPHYDLSHIDIALATINKSGHFLELIIEPKGNWLLNVDVFWDNVLRDSVSFNMGTNGAALGSFTLGTDALGGDQVANKKRRITGEGRRISLVAKNQGINEDFAISKFLLHYKRGNEALRNG